MSTVTEDLQDESLNDKTSRPCNLVISFPGEGQLAIHNPEQELQSDDQRCWLSLLRAMQELTELGDSEVNLILKRNRIEYLAPAQKRVAL